MNQEIDEIPDTIHELVTNMLNSAIIDMKLLEDIVSDKAEFRKIYLSANVDSLSPFQGFILSKLILESIEIMSNLLRKETYDEEHTQDEAS